MLNRKNQSTPAVQDSSVQTQFKTGYAWLEVATPQEQFNAIMYELFRHFRLNEICSTLKSLYYRFSIDSDAFDDDTLVQNDALTNEMCSILRELHKIWRAKQFEFKKVDDILDPFLTEWCGDFSLEFELWQMYLAALSSDQYTSLSKHDRVSLAMVQNLVSEFFGHFNQVWGH